MSDRGKRKEERDNNRHNENVLRPSDDVRGFCSKMKTLVDRDQRWTTPRSGPTTQATSYQTEGARLESCLQIVVVAVSVLTIHCASPVVFRSSTWSLQ